MTVGISRSLYGQVVRSIAHVGLLMSVAAVGQGVIPPPPTQSDEPRVTVAVDLAKETAPFRPIYNWFGFDEGNYSTTDLGRALMGELRDLSPVPVHIRVHHLLTSGNGQAELKFSSTNVYTEDANGKPVYDFKLLDGIFDAYKEVGVQPMVEFGFMPKDLAADLPDRHEYQVHYPHSTISGASNNPPKDYKKWGDLIRTVTAHLGSATAKRRFNSGISKCGTSRTSTIGTRHATTIFVSTTTRPRVCALLCQRLMLEGQRQRVPQASALVNI
jgi:hypothetical protein